MEYINSFKKLISKIKAVRSQETRYMLLSALLSTVSVVMLSIIVISLVELIAEGNETFRTILAAVIIIAFVIPGLVFLVPPMLRWLGIRNLPTEEDIAKRVGDEYPEIKDKLCNSIQIVKELDYTLTSKELAIAAFNDTIKSADTKDFYKIIDKTKTKKTLIFFSLSFIITFFVFFVFNSTMGAALYRIVNWDKSFMPPAPFSFDINPKHSSVLRNAKVLITVKAIGTAPIEIKLMMKELDQETFDIYNLKPDSSNNYQYEIQSAKSTVIYYASAEWLGTEVKSQLCTLTVIDKPIVRSMSGTIVYPGYTRLASKRFDEQNADISALRGSSVQIEVNSNKELKSAELIYLKNISFTEKDSVGTAKDSSIIRLSVNGKKANGGFSLSSNGQYYIRIRDKANSENENPIKYNIYTTNDDYPVISLIEPNSDAQVSEEALLPMRVAIADDYGFSGLKLHYRLVESKYAQASEHFTSINVPIIYSELASDVPYLWDLNKVDISPEDKYEYYFEVYDNDRISGPKSAKTSTMTVRLPSLEEVLKQADQSQDKMEKDLDKIVKQAEDVKKDIEELNRDMMKEQNNRKEMSWEQKKKAEDLMKKQADLQNKVGEIQKKLSEVTEQLKENNVLSQETLQKYMELQKLMQEVNSPELKKLQEKMKQAMDKLTPEQMQEALKNFKLDEEKFKQSIERTMKMLKRIQTEQKLDAISKKTDDLINKQDELTKKTENSNPNDKNKKDELANNQNALNKDLKDLQKDLEDFEKMMKELAKDSNMDLLKEAQKELNQQETSQEMNNSEKSLQNGDFNKAKQNQQQARKNLNAFKQGLKKLKDEMQNKLTKEAIRKMQKAVSDLNELSKNEENIKSSTQSLDPNSMQYKDIAKAQADNMAAMNSVISSMYDLSQKTFAVTPEMGKNLGDAMQEMQKSIQSLTDRNMSMASKSQEKSMSSMNKAVSQMQSMVAKMKKTGSCSNPGGEGEGDGDPQKSGGSAMMQKLQEMAAQQQSINQSMQSMGENQGSMSPEQQAKMQKLSNQQGSAQKSMEELAKEQKQNSAGGKKKALGDLEKIAQEMNEVVQDMKSGRITPETRKKQERILSRLLDATRSMTERDFEKNRESRSAQDMFRQSPKDIDMNTQEGKSAGLREFLRSIQNGYTKDYEILIKQYFDNMQSGK